METTRFLKGKSSKKNSRLLLYLHKSNILGVDPETLATAHDVVLPHKSMNISTDTATQYKH
jgi:hypothetical protein